MPSAGGRIRAGAGGIPLNVEALMARDTSTLTSKKAAAPELTRENRADSPVVQALRQQVANAFLLYANYKRYHWKTFGPSFRDLHKLFDGFADDVLQTIDPLAERIRMIGPDPPAHPLEWMELASVTAAATLETMRQMVEEANQNALVVIKEMRDGAYLADDRRDPGTVDLFSRLVQIHERHEWWLRDMLESGDGLVT
jgi:starvation-inducible DNA-binding protein